MAQSVYKREDKKLIDSININKVTKQKSRLEYRFLKEFNLTLGVISINETSIFKVISDIKKYLYFSILFFSLSFFIITLDRRLSKKITILISFLQFLFLISLILLIDYCSTKEDMKNFSPISSIINTSKFLKDNSLRKEGEIFLNIEDIDFLSQDNVEISGILEHSSKSIKEIYFPDAIKYSDDIISTTNDYIIKKFSFTLPINFEYNRYPLESNIISIKLFSLYGDKNSVVIPNFKKYDENMLLSSKWGLSKNLSINGWNVIGTFFTFIKDENFQLTYNIYLKRNILSPFISNLLPFFIIIGLLFILIVLTPRRARDVNMEFILGSISGLFFTILLSQNTLRDTISSGEILYLDYFYFFLYILLILVIFIYFLYQHQYIKYKLISRVKKNFCFWIFFLLTLITFFNF